MKTTNVLGVLTFICFLIIGFILYLEFSEKPVKEDKIELNYIPYFDGVDYAIEYLNSNNFVRKDTSINIKFNDFMFDFVSRDSSSYEKQFINGFYFTVHYYVNNKFIKNSIIKIDISHFYNRIDSCSKNYNSLNLSLNSSLKSSG